MKKKKVVHYDKAKDAKMKAAEEKKHTCAVLKFKKNMLAPSDDVLEDNNDDKASFSDSSNCNKSAMKKKNVAQKKNKKPDVIETGGKRNQGARYAIAPNYSEDEDYLISDAFDSVPVLDPIAPECWEEE